MTRRTQKYQILVLPLLLVFFIACNAEQKANEEKTEQLKASVESVQNKTIVEDESIPVENNGDGVKVKIKTTMGDMVIVLYDETPLHQKNFIKLVKEKFYDNILFHRVIKGFMVQAGDPDSKTAPKGAHLGSGGPGYTINAEFNPKLFHKKGALSAARLGDQMNPEKKSSGSQFYIVQGKKYNDAELVGMDKQLEMQAFMPLIRKFLNDNPAEMAKVQEKQQIGDQAGLDAIINSIVEKLKVEHPEVKASKLSDEQKKIYKEVGGTPHLDGGYTVFGEVVEGLEIIDKIAAVETDRADRPLEDVKILSMEILK